MADGQPIVVIDGFNVDALSPDVVENREISDDNRMLQTLAINGYSIVESVSQSQPAPAGRDSTT